MYSYPWNLFDAVGSKRYESSSGGTREIQRTMLELLNSGQVVAWSSRIKVPAMISSEYESRGVSLLGVDPEGELALGFNLNDVIEGRFLDGADDGGRDEKVERCETARPRPRRRQDREPSPPQSPG